MNPLSGVLSEAWRMYKAHAWHLLAIALVIYVCAAIIAALLALAGTVGALLGSIVELFAAFLLQATLIKAVQDVRDGRADLSISETVAAAAPYIWSVAAASIIAGVAITIGLILVIVPGLWLITIWAVIIPVIVIERSGALASFGRSRQLVRGHGWHVFGTLVLVFIILLIVDFVLGLIFLALPIVFRSGLSTIISGTLVAPFLALVVTLIYYRLVGVEAGGGYGAPGGYGTAPGTGGYGTTPAPGGYGSTPEPGGYGTGPVPDDLGSTPARSGFETGPVPEDAGTGPVPDDLGTSPARTGFETEPGQDDLGTSPARSGFETGPVPDDLGPTPAHSGFETGAVPDDADTGPAPEDFGTRPMPENLETDPAPDDFRSGPGAV